MKRNYIHIFMALFFCFALFNLPAKALDVNSNVKIGLVYGTNAKPFANLQNVRGFGGGYNFGYFDKTSYAFTALASSEEIEITVVKNKPMYIGAGNSYYDEMPANTVAKVGPYSLQKDTVYYSYAEAQNVCNELALHNYMAYVAYINGQYRVRIGAYMTQAEANSDLNPVAAAALDSITLISPSATCYTVTKTGTGKILFQLDNGGTTLGIMPISNSAKAQTWSKGYKYYGGFEYNRVNGNDITVINVVNIDDYLKGVVPNEMSPSWPIEALKAQALCAKSYCLNNAGRHANEGFDLCNTTDCQVYYGTNNSSAISDQAVELTHGLAVTYNGQIAQTYYHSSSGGYTENSENIWGGTIPYLRAVEDKYLTHTKPWSYTVTALEIANILRSKGYDCSNVSDLYISQLTEAGNVRAITIVIDGKPTVFSGEKARTILNTDANDYAIKSHRFSITPNGGEQEAINKDIYVNDSPLSGALSSKYFVDANATPSKIQSGEHYAIGANGTALLAETSHVAPAAPLSFSFSGTGSGHHIGLSQWGAYDMAEKGFTFEEIIKFYFTGVQVG